jgi:cysteine synthase A
MRACLGGSSGINIAGAMRMAADMGRAYDCYHSVRRYGTRYQMTVQSNSYLRKGLPVSGMVGQKHDIPNVLMENV